MRCGAIHFFRCLVACLISSARTGFRRTGSRSPNDCRNRPRSPGSKRASLSAMTLRSRASRSSRASSVAGGLVARRLDHGVEGVVQGAARRTFQGLIHGVSLPVLDRRSLLPKPRLLRNFWQERAFGPVLGAFGLRHKIVKRPAKTLSKPVPRWYIPPAPSGHGLQGCLLRKPPKDRSARPSRGHAFGPGFPKRLSNGLSRGGAAR